MLKARCQFKVTAGVFFRVSGEEPLNYAGMLEQVVFCFLLFTPSMLRKYGFHLFLFGALSKKYDQINHAISAFKGAQSVFKGTTWSLISMSISKNWKNVSGGLQFLECLMRYQSPVRGSGLWLSTKGLPGVDSEGIASTAAYNKWEKATITGDFTCF
ncbi:hypothetical protein ACS0TY_033299 [Phlomoides rotata]